jgi:putative hydrolase of the HAD superfamily
VDTKTYTHLFFDLDHTLWDTNTNAALSLVDMFERFKLQQYGIPSFQAFIDKYIAINNKMWTDYSLGKIRKSYLRTGRFELTLKQFNIKDPELVELLAEYFVAKTPLQKLLIPFAHDLLQHVHTRYELYIITNGFSEAQRTKLKSSSIEHYFKEVFISEEVGCHKPNPEIYFHAVKNANAKIENCLMIGDNHETDIAGAIAAKMDCVFLNTQGIKHNLPVTFETDCLSKIIQWL